MQPIIMVGSLYTAFQGKGLQLSNFTRKHHVLVLGSQGIPSLVIFAW